MKKKKENNIYNSRSFTNWIYIIYIIVIVVLLCALCIRSNNYIFPSIILVVMILLVTLYEIRKDRKRKQENIAEYTEDMNLGAQNVLINSAIPMIIAKQGSNIIWRSTSYNDSILKKEEQKIMLFLKRLDTEMEKKAAGLGDISQDEKKKGNILSKITLGEKAYDVYVSYLETINGSMYDASNYIYTIYFLDNTENEKLKERLEDEKLLIGLVKIDNYNEILSKIVSSERSRVLSEIERDIFNWANMFNGIVIKSDTDDYVILFQSRYIEKIREDKFSILDDVKRIQTTVSIPATLSIAVSEAGENLYDVYNVAKELLTIILGRGGDQAGIVIDGNYKFYGGKTKEVEKQTKVKARVISNKLSNVAKLSSNIIIMGHENIDIDALGAAIGIRAFFKEFNPNTYIATKADSPGLGDFKEVLREQEDYEGVIIDKEDAINKMSKDTLLVIVDVHRKDFTEFPELVDMAENIAIIDHHRKLVDYIEDVDIEYHEVYASSASELVVEIIEYAEKAIPLTQFEAESLYGGILVDTKNFTFKTGVRTFEAAAFLRKFGIDIVRVKKYFQSDLDAYMDIYDIIRNAKMIEKNIAIARNTKKSESANLECAKAADEMLNISDVEASITYGYDGKKMQICLRSLGEINVQVIAEKLGGGGHMVLAGAQLKTDDYDNAEEKILEAVNEYIEELDDNT